MPIKFAFKKLPVDENGKSYDSLEDFQISLIEKLIDGTATSNVSVRLIESKDELLEILELTMDSRPAARGVKKPRKPKATPEAPALALT